MKKIKFLVALVLVISILSGCAGTAVVYYSDCTCPAESHEPQVTLQPENTNTTPVAEGALKTGLAIIASAEGSVSAEAGKAGQAKYDVTIAAVLVDENGVIVDCLIDSIGTSVNFDDNGYIDAAAIPEVLTKDQLGENYGMKKAGSDYEWNEQAAALCEYAIGKTVGELRNGAVGETGKASDADLASKASIYLGGYVDAIEAAVNNAAAIGSQAGDELRFAVAASLTDSKSAEEGKNGTAQLNCDVAVITMNGEIITGCIIDSLQAKVNFDASGVIGELGQMLTKNQLGEAYGMKKFGSKYEWNEQVAYFCEYVTGRTVAQVSEISVNEQTKPTDADIASTVTIAVGGFIGLIQKAAQ